jgi:hypothetical protein
MPNKRLQRLMDEQGNKCFFCKKHLSPANASVEHLVARANGGRDGNDNCVACCESLNKLLADKPLDPLSTTSSAIGGIWVRQGRSRRSAYEVLFDGFAGADFAGL